MSRLAVDLNADLGEGGDDAAMLRWVTSANIACGTHAGNAETMRATIVAAMAAGVGIGAHPGMPDRAGFGRAETAVSAAQAAALVAEQLTAFSETARSTGASLRHVKLHGTLYHLAARDAEVAEAIAGVIAGHDRGPAVFCPAGSRLAAAAAARGLRVVAEFFADRNYLPDGTLVPRSRLDALLHEPAVVAERAVRAVGNGVVRSIEGRDIAVVAGTVCVHGDSPGAAEMARAIRARLEVAGITVAHW